MYLNGSSQTQIADGSPSTGRDRDHPIKIMEGNHTIGFACAKSLQSTYSSLLQKKNVEEFALIIFSGPEHTLWDVAQSIV